MPRGERRVEPFGHEHARLPQAAHGLVDPVDAVAHRLRELLALAGDTEVTRERADRVLDLLRSRGSSEIISAPVCATRLTSPLETAQTSHRSCVTITSGASCSSSSASTA